MFSEKIDFPSSYDDIEKIYQQYIYEGETDDDAFTSGELKQGRSYFFYGKKAFEFNPESAGKSKLTIIYSEKKKKTLTSASTTEELLSAYNELRDMKRQIFRNLPSEPFGCCNDFLQCSDAMKCLHTEDRFYNNCMYRKNLEAGRIFYGKNKNI